VNVTYPIKTLSQLPLVLKGLRKSKRLTQAAMAEKLGITQQSYAYFEANPATATLERLFLVLRLLDVEISLDQVTVIGNKPATFRAKVVAQPAPSSKKATPPVASRIAAKAKRVTAPSRKKESW